MVVDQAKSVVQYAIIKNIDSKTREARATAFLEKIKDDGLRELLIAPSPLEPFAALHSLTDVSS